MTLDELLTAARAAPGQSRANRRFWKALHAEIDRNLERYSYAKRVEIGQRVMLAVWHKIDRYEQEGPDSLGRWVRAIIRLEVHHTWFKAARLARLESRLLRQVARSPGLTPSSYVLMLEQAALIHEAAEQLSDRHRRALDLSDPFKVAASERISLTAARMLLHRALRRLAQLVDERRNTNRVRVITSS